MFLLIMERSVEDKLDDLLLLVEQMKLRIKQLELEARSEKEFTTPSLD